MEGGVYGTNQRGWGRFQIHFSTLASPGLDCVLCTALSSKLASPGLDCVLCTTQNWLQSDVLLLLFVYCTALPSDVAPEAGLWRTVGAG